MVSIALRGLDSRKPLYLKRGQSGKKEIAVKGNYDDQTAVVVEGSVRLAQHPLPFIHVLQDLKKEAKIKAFIRERQAVNIGMDDVQSESAAYLDILVRQVYTDNLSLGKHPTQLTKCDAFTAAQVRYPLVSFFNEGKNDLIPVIPVPASDAALLVLLPLVKHALAEGRSKWTGMVGLNAVHDSQVPYKVRIGG